MVFPAGQMSAIFQLEVGVNPVLDVAPEVCTVLPKFTGAIEFFSIVNIHQLHLTVLVTTHRFLRIPQATRVLLPKSVDEDFVEKRLIQQFVLIHIVDLRWSLTVVAFQFHLSLLAVNNQCLLAPSRDVPH